MGRVYTPRFALYLDYPETARYGSTPSAWNVRAQGQIPGLGKPTPERIKRYIAAFIDSQNPGRANAHLPDVMGNKLVPTGGRVVDQFSGELVAEWRAVDEPVYQMLRDFKNRAED